MEIDQHPQQQHHDQDNSPSTVMTLSGTKRPFQSGDDNASTAADQHEKKRCTTKSNAPTPVHAPSIPPPSSSPSITHAVAVSRVSLLPKPHDDESIPLPSFASRQQSPPDARETEETPPMSLSANHKTTNTEDRIHPVSSESHQVRPTTTTNDDDIVVVPATTLPFRRPSSSSSKNMRSIWGPLLNAVLFFACISAMTQAWLLPTGAPYKQQQTPKEQQPNNLPSFILPPPGFDWTRKNSQTSFASSAVSLVPTLSQTVTLRSFLANDDAGFALAMGPAYFGFYGYFGVLAAWDEQVQVVATSTSSTSSSSTSSSTSSPLSRITKVAGASAGAIAAVLMGSGVPPRQAADFASTLTLDQINDFPGFGGLFRGHLAEQTMHNFLVQQMTSSKNNATTTTMSSSSLLLQHAPACPVGVSAFDLQTLQGKVLTKGNMARAALASATFPLLFQPMGWKDATTGEEYTLIDGGIGDMAGTAALEALESARSKSNNDMDGEQPPQRGGSVGERIINLKVGAFYTKRPPGPDEIGAKQVLSISLQNLPPVGPWALEMGPLAVQAAYDAMVASLDLPLYVSADQRHYELHIDASQFWSDPKKETTK